MRRGTLAPTTQASQADVPVPFPSFPRRRESKGEGARIPQNPHHSREGEDPAGRGAGTPFKDRANASLIRQTSTRLVGRGRLQR